MTPYLLVSGDFVKTGGMDRANYALAEHLARIGREVHLVAHRIADELRGFANVRFHRVPKPANSYLLGAPLLDRIGRLWARRLHGRGARVLVNGGNCAWGDVNWVHYVHAAYRPHVAAGTLRKARNAWKHRMFLAEERRSLLAARLVISNSKVTTQHLTQLVGVPAERIRTVYYGIDPTSFSPGDPAERAATRAALGWPSETPVVGFIGALGDRRKGFDTVFDAWTRLCRNASWDARLAVIGSGSELPAWQRRAADAGLGGRIEFLGFRNDVPQILRACDALVAPTRYEAYGLGVHEALCCGLPAFVSASSGVAERYPAELSKLLLLRSPDDSDELSDRLCRWREKLPDYRSNLEPFSRLLRTHSWERMAEQMLQAVEADKVTG